MAYVANLTDEEEQNQNAQGPIAPSGGGGLHISPSNSLVSGSGGGGSGAGSAPSAPQSPGGQFATLDKYVTANTPNASGLADQVVAPINAQAQQGAQDIGTTLSGIKDQVKGAYTPQDQGLLDKANQDIVSFANDPNNVKAFQAQANDAYKGPNSAEGTPEYQKLYSDFSNTYDTGKSITSNTAGQETLLKNIEQHPENAGVTGLNEAILSQDPNSLSKVQNAFQPFQGLMSTLSSGAAAIDPSISKAQTESQAANKSANDLIAKNVSDLSSIPNEAAAANAARNSYNTTIQDTNTKLSPFNQYVKAYLAGGGSNINNPFANLVNQTAIVNPITTANFATKAQYDKAKALGILAPGTATPLDQNNYSQAGTAPSIPTPNTYDLTSDVNKVADDATKASYREHVNEVHTGSPYVLGKANPAGFENTPLGQSWNLGQPLTRDKANGTPDPQWQTAYESLLNQLMQYSNGNISPNKRSGGYTVNQ